MNVGRYGWRQMLWLEQTTVYYMAHHLSLGALFADSSAVEDITGVCPENTEKEATTSLSDNLYIVLWWHSLLVKDISTCFYGFFVFGTSARRCLFVATRHP